MNCIYLSAGLGKRMKETCPKQFLTLLGKPVFIYALELLENIDEIDRIIVMYHPEYRSVYEKYISDYNISKVEFVKGGRTRQESVYNGLVKSDSSRVLIHEAARPFISYDLVSDLMKYKDESAVIPTVPIPFTVSSGNTYMDGILDRDKLHNIQLPQIFDRNLLIKAHEDARRDNFTANEDGVLMFRASEKVRFVKGSENNIKITTPLDLIIAEELVKGVYQ